MVLYQKDLYGVNEVLLLLNEHGDPTFLFPNLRGEKLNYKSVAKEISKPPFLAPEVRWESKFAVYISTNACYKL